MTTTKKSSSYAMGIATAAVPRLRPQDAARRLAELEESIARAQAALEELPSLLCGSSPRMKAGV